MAGLEVTPNRPSFSTIAANSPEVIRPRRILSYQILWPNFCTSRSGFMVHPFGDCRMRWQLDEFSPWDVLWRPPTHPSAFGKLVIKGAWLNRNQIRLPLHSMFIRH